MTYSAVYSALIAKRLQNPLEKGCGIYVEEHHIIPKSEGGIDDKENLVCLTAREHYVAHLLLAKIYNDNKMWCALNRLVHGNCFKKYNHISGRSYESLKQNFAIQQSKRFKGHKKSEETRRNMSEAHKGRKPSSEAIRHSALVRSKVVLAYTLSGDFVREFPSAVQAGVELGCSQSAVSKGCRGVSKTCRGYVLKYKEDANG